MQSIKRIIAILFSFAAIFITTCSILLVYIDKPGPLLEQKIVIFTKNQSVSKISDILEQNKIINYSPVFSIIAKIISLKYPLKAGEYRFTPHISAKSVFNIMIKGKSVIHKLTIIEGLTSNQILNIIKEENLLFGDINLHIGEGELLPDTYFFSYGDTKQLIVKRMYREMQKHLDLAWSNRASDLPIKTSLEALTLASIVEKETSNALERPRVAAVFINRLKRNMKLQADPTTIYSITLGKIDFNRSLTKSDLLNKSDFNTYFTNGLPPHPICNPSRASIHAVLHPLETDELYFVVDGFGGHKFSNDYSQHKKYVNEYRKRFLNK